MPSRAGDDSGIKNDRPAPSSVRNMKGKVEIKSVRRPQRSMVYRAGKAKMNIVCRSQCVRQRTKNSLSYHSETPGNKQRYDVGRTSLSEDGRRIKGDDVDCT